MASKRASSRRAYYKPSMSSQLHDMQSKVIELNRSLITITAERDKLTDMYIEAMNALGDARAEIHRLEKELALKLG